MSSNWVTRSEFEQVLVELASLRLQVGELRAQSRRESEDFEVVSSAPASSAPELSATTSAVATSTDLSSERVAIAEQIGKWIRRGLNQQNRGLSGREKLDLASRIYVVVKDISGEIFDPPKVFNNWSGAKSLVSVDKQLGDSIFVGFPSKTEARIAVSAAGLKIPDALTKHQ